MPPLMKYTTDWRQDGPGVIVITPGGVGPVRLLGLFLAAPGAWLLYQFIGGVLQPGTMTIFGWVLLPIMAALFLVPGWIILFGRKRTRLDATRREAIEAFDLLVYTRRKTTAIPRDAHVLLRYEQAGKSNLYATHVYLAAGGTPILLTMFGSNEKPAALEFARKVAAPFGLDVQDRCVEGGEVAAGGVVVDRLGEDEAD
jgi:hypothetical protein